MPWVTVLLVFFGLGTFVWGLVLYVAFGVAVNLFNRIQSTSAYGAFKDSEVVQAGEQLATMTIDMIPNGFVRSMVRRVVPEGTDLAGTLVQSILSGKRDEGMWLAIGGAVIFVAAFFVGPWLQSFITRG